MDQSGFGSPIDLMQPARERAAGTGRMARLVSGTYVPRACRIRGLRYGSGMAHLPSGSLEFVRPLPALQAVMARVGLSRLPAGHGSGWAFSGAGWRGRGLAAQWVQ